MFDLFMGVFSKDLGIDLGTANTLICARGEGILLSEPSVVAIDRRTNQVMRNGDVIVGERARRMIGKTPDSVVAVRPLRDGVIADFEVTETMLDYFIRKAHGRSFFRPRPRVVIAVPTGITAIEKRALIESAMHASAREVFLVHEAMAAALGVGLPVSEPRGSMIMDIGGGTCEVAVIALNDLVVANSLKIAGDEMNEAIVKFMKQVYNLQVGEQTAEQIKIEIGSAYPLSEELIKEVRGQDTLAGLPRTVLVRSEEIREALKPTLEDILKHLVGTLEQTAPELHADLIESGITLAGGGSLLRGLDRLIARETGLPVRRAEEPLLAVARGTGVILENFEQYLPFLESAQDIG